MKQVFRFEDGRQFSGHDRRILGSKPEDDQRPDVRQYCVANVRHELVQVLVSKHQAQLVLADTMFATASVVKF